MVRVAPYDYHLILGVARWKIEIGWRTSIAALDWISYALSTSSRCCVRDIDFRMVKGGEWGPGSPGIEWWSMIDCRPNEADCRTQSTSPSIISSKYNTWGGQWLPIYASSLTQKILCYTTSTSTARYITNRNFWKPSAVVQNFGDHHGKSVQKCKLNVDEESGNDSLSQIQLEELEWLNLL